MTAAVQQWGEAHVKGLEHKERIVEMQTKNAEQQRQHEAVMLDREHAHMIRAQEVESAVEKDRIGREHTLRLDAQGRIERLGGAAIACLTLLLVVALMYGKVEEVTGPVGGLIALAGTSFGAFQWGKAKAGKPKKKDEEE